MGKGITNYYCCRSIVNSLTNMKAFSLEKAVKTSSGIQGRLGCLQLPVPSAVGEDKDNLAVGGENGGHSPDRRAYRTPMYIVHTQTGTVPHITPEVFKLIYPTSAGGVGEGPGPMPAVQVSVDSTMKFAEALETFQKGIAKYMGFPELPVFLTVHDPLQALRSGHNDKFGVALWSRHGRSGLTPEKYVGVMKSYKCELTQIISDYDIRAGESGMKRFRKSMSRAEEYTAVVLKENSREGGCKRSGLFMTLEAAWFKIDEDLAKKTVVNLLESQQEIEGVVIVGIQDRFTKGANLKNNSKEKARGDTERLNVCEDITGSLEVVGKIVQVLPSNLPKFAPGPFRLSQMVDLIAKGIDIFDSSVASRMADDAEAFLLDELEAKLSLLSSSLNKLPNSVNESLPDRSSNNAEDENGSAAKRILPDTPVISLKDKRFFDDFGPISKACTCYTCRKHTRSYVHHLYATDELLGPVLIQMHNLTAMDQFFKIMRCIIEDTATGEALEEKFDMVKKLLKYDDVLLSNKNIETGEEKLRSSSTS